jgi:hypothetical protein
MKNKQADQLGIIRLYTTFYTLAGIQHYVGATTNRYNEKFDKDFMSWAQIGEIIFYFPETKMFLTPTDLESRYGMLPEKLTNNYGLFIKPVTIGEVTSGLPVTLYIPPVPADNTYFDMDVAVSFGTDFNDATLKQSYRFGGYYSVQPIFDLIPNENKEELTDNLIINTVGQYNKLVTKEIKNSDINLSPIDSPFVIESEVVVNTLIEHAGNDVIFKIGTLIGRQEEMYDEKDRQNEIEIDYPHHYVRKLKFEIPDGYTVKGLDALNMNIEYSLNNKKVMGFVSSYEKQGKTILVTIKEYYTEVTYPLSEYENFRKVINAAADFNKISLVFVKE